MIELIDVSCKCERCEANNTGFYYMKALCVNCNTPYTLKVRKGDTARTATCSVCGCCKVLSSGVLASEPVATPLQSPAEPT
jgi:hypothetical protein